LNEVSTRFSNAPGLLLLAGFGFDPSWDSGDFCFKGSSKKFPLSEPAVSLFTLAAGNTRKLIALDELFSGQSFFFLIGTPS
jgi:hypothetical protein